MPSVGGRSPSRWICRWRWSLQPLIGKQWPPAEPVASDVCLYPPSIARPFASPPRHPGSRSRRPAVWGVLGCRLPFACWCQPPESAAGFSRVPWLPLPPFPLHRLPPRCFLPHRTTPPVVPEPHPLPCDCQMTAKTCHWHWNPTRSPAPPRYFLLPIDGRGSVVTDGAVPG